MSKTIKSNIPTTVAGLKKFMAERFAPPATRRAAERIGMLLRGNMDTAYMRSGLGIRTGNLINSLAAKITDSRDGGSNVEAGSFGVPYAAIHEFGFKGIVSVSAHSRRGRPVKKHDRKVSFRERRFVRGGFEKAKPRIRQILEEFYGRL